jgi:hypothetical protein
MAPQLIAALKRSKPVTSIFHARVIAVGGLIFAELLHIQERSGLILPCCAFCTGASCGALHPASISSRKSDATRFIIIFITALVSGCYF